MSSPSTLLLKNQSTNHRGQLPLGHQQNDTRPLLFLREAKSISFISGSLVLTGLLLLFARFIISVFFLGRIGDLALAGGSLALGFANTTGYSILSGLALGMEPICSQAFRAKRFDLLGITTSRTVLLLLLASLPYFCAMA